MATSAQVDALVALYAGYFNRAPDPAGLQFWIDQIDGGREFNTIAADFAASAEATALYPYLTAPDVATPSTFITSIYQNLFNRAPEPEGLQFWTDVLESGAVSAADMIESIINGAIDAPDATPPTFDAATLENKIEVGRDFAEDAANTSGFEFDAEAKSAAIAAIDGVTNDEATVVAAKAATDAYLSGEANEGDTFTLTTGVDVVNGTADNDTFNAQTVNPSTGVAADTFTSFDEIDGGAGTDTLNLFVDEANDFNNGFPTAASVNNVEVVNLNYVDLTDPTDAGVLELTDASNYTGVEQLWQVGAEADVTNLGASTAAGFRGATSDAVMNVEAASGVSTVTVALDGTVENAAAGANALSLNVTGAGGTAGSVETVTVAGTIAAGLDDPATQTLALAVTAGDDVEALTVSTAIDDTTLTIVDADNDVDSVDASGSTGGVIFAGDNDVNTFTSGSGDDNITTTAATVADNAATTADETETAEVTTGAGDDSVTINSTGTGATTVSTGAGADSVELQGDGSGTLTVDLGDGDDSFSTSGTGAVSSGDSVDGGAGSDTLTLASVGAANIGAFSNFEVFDVAGLASNLDVAILASNNTVTEIVGSAALGANPVELINLGAGVGFRATANMGANELELTQATAGDLSVTLDADEAIADATTDNNTVTVDATNATSVTATFDSDNIDTLADGYANTQTIALDTGAATSIEVVSGGTESSNVLNLTDTSTDGTNSILTSITASGDQALDLTNITITNGTNGLATVDASAMTGDLTIELADLAEGATVSLGSGSDTVQLAVNAGTTQATIEELSGFEAAASNDASDVEEADIIDYANAATIIADDDDNAGDVDIVDGVVKFLGAGPSTFAQAVNLVDTALGANDNAAALFEYLGNSYVFVENAAGDSIVELAGTTGVTELGVDGNDNLFIV